MNRRPPSRTNGRAGRGPSGPAGRAPRNGSGDGGCALNLFGVGILLAALGYAVVQVVTS